jgi:hypothetical protein
MTRIEELKLVGFDLHTQLLGTKQQVEALERKLQAVYDEIVKEQSNSTSKIAEDGEAS